MRISVFLRAAIAALIIGVFGGQAFAGAVEAEAAIKAKLKTSLPQLSLVAVEETAAPGIYAIVLDSGEEMMISADGSYIFTGDLLKVQTRGILNLSEQNRGKKRIAVLSKMQDKDLVVFQAEGEEKGEVIAFTDTSCGYCQKFHAEVPKLNKMGITVKYAAWPRYGLQSPAGKVIANVWCSKDRAEGMTKAKTRQPAGDLVAACDQSKVINEQIALGRQVGVKGTPAIYTMDGRQVGGYRSAEDLAKEFGQ